MVVPDFELIAEIMLVAEGFLDARLLARKFLTLYSLCKELLSKQDHYDWGLRAIKSVLVVAGSLKRGDPDRPEDQVRFCSLKRETTFVKDKNSSVENYTFISLGKDKKATVLRPCLIHQMINTNPCGHTLTDIITRWVFYANIQFLL